MDAFLAEIDRADDQLVGMLVAVLFDYRRLERYAYVIYALTLGLVGLFFNSTGGRADPIARRVKAGLSGIPVVGLLVLLYFSAASEVVLGWTRYPPDGLCAALDPNDPFRQVAQCVPKFGSWALRLLAFDIALLALLFLLQGVVVSSEEGKERQAHAVR